MYGMNFVDPDGDEDPIPGLSTKYVDWAPPHTIFTIFTIFIILTIFTIFTIFTILTIFIILTIFTIFTILTILTNPTPRYGFYYWFVGGTAISTFFLYIFFLRGRMS